MAEMRVFKCFRGWSGPIVLVLVLGLLKLALSVGSFVFHSKAADTTLSDPEVFAAGPKAPSQSTVHPSKALALATTQQSTSATQPPNISIPDMVSYLDRREAALKQKEQALQQKEEYLTKLKQEVEKKLKKLTAMQQNIQDYRNQKQQNQNAKIRSLAKIYANMKPKQAAKLMQNLDDQLVVNVISTMNTNQAASILANMDVKKAAEISQRLSQH